MKLSHEIVEKIKSANSADEVLAIAKECNVEISAEEADKYFHQLHSGELDDDLLDNVSGGCDESFDGGDDDDYEDKNKWLIFSKI